MKRLPPLNEQQQQLVEKNLTVIHWAIHNFVKINETVFGFEYDDLYGEGCVLLCKAAATYDSEKGRFSAYAQTVVKNGLLSYCRIMCNRQNRQRLLLDPKVFEDNEETYAALLAIEDPLDELTSEIDALALLASVKKNYHGIVRLGIEALEWKKKGLSGRDIADLYGVQPNTVGAWISRAAVKLREDERVLTWKC